MAFSKGKRIEDGMSARVVDLAMAIGCKEGPEALTVTRLCRELACDRRVIYNRFRDIDEVCFIVSGKCNGEILDIARKNMKTEFSFDDNLKILVESLFTCIYERNSYFQHFSSMYVVTDEGIDNVTLNALVDYINAGKKVGEVADRVNTRNAAESIWFLMNGICTMLASNVNYKYREALATLRFGLDAACKSMK